jgi:hypothetical protein
MLEQADNTLIMDDQQQRSLDRGGCRPSNRTPHPSGIPGELTFMQPELVDLLTVGTAAFSARAQARGMRPARRLRTRHGRVRKRNQRTARRISKIRGVR